MQIRELLYFIGDVLLPAKRKKMINKKSSPPKQWSPKLKTKLENKSLKHNIEVTCIMSDPFSPMILNMKTKK